MRFAFIKATKSFRGVPEQREEDYHVERNHQGIGNALIDDQRGRTNMSGDTERCKRLGGVLNYYRRAA